MGNTTVIFESQEPDASSNVKCDVDGTYYPHLLLIPAGIIITILAFLQQRRTFRKEVWGGRPGVVVPIDFLGMDHDRLAIMCVFGAATGDVLLLVGKLNITGHGNVWEKAFLLIGTCIEFAFLYYPYFGCLASYHRIIGALMGLPYAVVSFCVSIISGFQKCNNYTTNFVVFAILAEIPLILCHVFIVGKFILVLYNEIKEYGTCKMQFFFRKDEQSMQVKLVRPWLKDYVRNLINPKPARLYSRTEFYLRKIYNPEKNFKFSTQTLSVIMVCFILLYAISLLMMYLASLGLDVLSKADGNFLEVKIGRGLVGSLVGAAIFAAILCVISLVRFMENHKNNMLKMFKGDKSFIPKCIRVSQFMVGKGLRYHSFQVGYFLWGYMLLILLFFVICFCFYLFVAFSWIQKWVRDYSLEGGGVLLGVALLTRLSLLITAVTVFRDHDYPKDVISINNRNVYLVFSYFWFFLGLPMGFFSAISRILKSMIVGALMLPRIDYSIMPDGFQRIDKGFNAYICYLHVQTAFRNPVLRVFCQLLVDKTKNKKDKNWTCSARARARWFLALTLAHNPQLASERKSAFRSYIFPVHVGSVEHDDVKIEVGPYNVLKDK